MPRACFSPRGRRHAASPLPGALITAPESRGTRAEADAGSGGGGGVLLGHGAHDPLICLSLLLKWSLASFYLPPPPNPSCFGDLTVALPAPPWWAGTRFSRKRLGESTASATAASPGIVPFHLAPREPGRGRGKCRGPLSRGTLVPLAMDDLPPDLQGDQAIPTREKGEGGKCPGAPQSPTCIHSLNRRQIEDPPAWGRSNTGHPSAVTTKKPPAAPPAPAAAAPRVPGCRG